MFVPTDLMVNLKNTTRMGLFLGLGDRPEHWFGQYIKPSIVYDALCPRESDKRQSVTSL